MGLIDVLTQYDTKKKAAHAAKTVKHGVSIRGWTRTCSDGSGVVSCWMQTEDANDLFLLCLCLVSVAGWC